MMTIHFQKIDKAHLKFKSKKELSRLQKANSVRQSEPPNLVLIIRGEDQF